MLSIPKAIAALVSLPCALSSCYCDFTSLAKCVCYDDVPCGQPAVAALSCTANILGGIQNVQWETEILALTWHSTSQHFKNRGLRTPHPLQKPLAIVARGFARLHGGYRGSILAVLGRRMVLLVKLVLLFAEQILQAGNLDLGHGVL